MLTEHKGFTPGPWRVTLGGVHSAYTVSPILKWNAFSNPSKVDTLKANATLIADAPNLYQKLLAVRNAVRLAKQTGDNEGAMRVITEIVGE